MHIQLVINDAAWFMFGSGVTLKMSDYHKQGRIKFTSHATILKIYSSLSPPHSALPRNVFLTQDICSDCRFWNVNRL